MSTKTRARVLAAAVFVLLSTGPVQAEGVKLTQLQSLEQFQQEFEKDDDIARLVLLLSPT